MKINGDSKKLGSAYYERWISDKDYRKGEFLSNFISVNNTTTKTSRGRELYNHNIDLAAYVTSRALLRRSLDSVYIDSLRKANDSVSDTRNMLSLGRSNVDFHIKKSPEIFWRGHFLRSNHLPRNNFSELVTNAIIMNTGNCGEHSRVLTAIHSQRLSPDEKVSAVNGCEIDHCWSELTLKDNQRVIMDAWCYGPAIMSEDSAFSEELSDREERTIIKPDFFTPENIIKSMRQHYIKITNNRRIFDRWDTYKKNCEHCNLTISQESLWELTPVLSDDFFRALSNVSNHNNIKKKLGKYNPKLSESPLYRTSLFDKTVQEKIAIGKEIMAIGAVRNIFDGTIMDGLKNKAEIIKTIERKFE